MLRLNLLGALDVVDAAGRSKSGEIAGTKPLALLAFLVVEGAERPVRRDTVIGLLWPDSTQKNARQSLSQNLHVLRTVLGDVIVSQGQEGLSIDRSLINSDIFEFVELARTGQLEEATHVYKGEFAAGLYVKESPEFDEWMSRQRLIWRERFDAVLRKLCQSAIEAGHLNEAASWAEKLLDVAPQQEELVRELIRKLIEHGLNPTALRLYDQYERTLHLAYDIAPALDITALIERASERKRTQGFRKSRIHVADPHKWRTQGRMSSALLLVLGVTLGLLALRLLALFPSKANGSHVVAATSPPKIAVTDFGYIGPAQRAATVLNEALQWRLKAAGFDVVDGSGQDTAAIRKAASREQAITFIIGGVVDASDEASLVARLWLKDAASGRRIWESQFSQKEANAHMIATQLSAAAATNVRKAAGLATDAASDMAGVSADSWRDVYRARERIAAAADMQRAGSSLGSTAELIDAEATLVDITRREPDWALPWVLRARINLDKSITALIAGDMERGSKELDRGIRMLDSVSIHPQSADVYEMRATLLYRKWVFGIADVGDAARTLTRAESDLREALRLGHERSDSYAALSGVMFAQGKYVEAFVYARRAYDSNIFLRNNEEIVTRLFNSALHAGDDASANQWCNELQELQPGKWPAVMCRVHVAGFSPRLVDIKGLQTEIENVVAAPQIRRTVQPRLRAAYAISLAQLGMSDSARTTLARLGADQTDPEVQLFCAFALAALKDAPQAHAMLRDYLSRYRGTRSAALHMRWLN
ncbi:MAG TPA: BTAD domain-containing putative transcriptional regulator [Pyrinomonadaceae bacterium]|nr:BTAD domain-containing putative transcriptional regulator [Pyrinomonadaceae bacterium]